MQSDSEITPLDRVEDKYNIAVPGETAKRLVVVDVHSTRADEFTVNGKTLAESVDCWPPETWTVNLPDGYNPDRDTVVEVVFYESLDRVFGGAWVDWDSEKLKELCELNDVTIYAYHNARLDRQE